jgi:hypothetical protein
MHTCIVTIVVLSAAMSGLAQAKPDFSGEWILNRQASTLSPGADGVKSGIVRIEHREPTFKYGAKFETASNPIEFQFELQSDGRDVAGSQQGVQSVSSLRWDGNVLVFTAQTQRPNGEMTIEFRYELLDGGRRLRAAEQLRSAAYNQDNVWMFDHR